MALVFNALREFCLVLSPSSAKPFLSIQVGMGTLFQILKDAVPRPAAEGHTLSAPARPEWAPTQGMDLFDLRH